MVEIACLVWSQRCASRVARRLGRQHCALRVANKNHVHVDVGEEVLDTSRLGIPCLMFDGVGVRNVHYVSCPVNSTPVCPFRVRSRGSSKEFDRTESARFSLVRLRFSVGSKARKLTNKNLGRMYEVEPTRAFDLRLSIFWCFNLRNLAFERSYIDYSTVRAWASTVPVSPTMQKVHFFSVCSGLASKPFQYTRPRWIQCAKVGEGDRGGPIAVHR